MTRLHLATLSDPAPGETECGDLALHLALPAQPGQPGDPAHPALTPPLTAHWLVLIDGLGHGPAAAQAAQVAARAIAQAAEHHAPAPDDLPAQLAQLDHALARTRGAAVGWVWLQGTRLRHAGVGNTRALRWRDGQVQRLPSHYGVLGDGHWSAAAAQGTRPDWPQVQDIDVRPGDWLLLFSDGLHEALQIDLMRPEWACDPALLCRELLTRWRQPRDDAAVLVARVLP